MKISETVWSIDAGFFCAGVVEDGGTVIDAAPVLKWAIGKDWSFVRGYLEGRGDHVVRAK